MRIILHVDMDCFFAQCEERERPQIKGKPVVVGADPKNGAGRGVVSTCNYDARKFGIKSAMPISTAWKRCPNAIFLPHNFELYSSASRAVMEIFRKYSNKFEQVSIDEAYLDLSHAKNYETARKIALSIKAEVLEKEKLTCSVGIGPNKLVAKIAAGERKPNGLTIIPAEEVEPFLFPKKAGALFGIGIKTEQRLNELGIMTVQDIANTPEEVLAENFGSFGYSMLAMARGNDDREVIQEWVTKSIGRQITFEHDTRDARKIMDVIDSIIPEIYRELRSQDFFYKTLVLKVRYSDFETHTKNKTLPDHTDNIKALRLMAQENLAKFLTDKRKIRLIGMSVHNLREKHIKQPQQTLTL